MRLPLAVMLAGLTGFAGTEPKAKPEDYPVHGRSGDIAIGAEYMVRSISSPKTSFITNDYLVVEVGFFPPRTGAVIGATRFTLRVNGSKEELLTQAPGMVAASVKYPDWSNRREVVAQAGPVIIGPPVPTERFPGDRRAPVPRRPPAPQDDGSSGIEREEVSPSEVIEATALDEGPVRAARSGYLFFPYTGKLTKIKSVELVYRPESGEPLTLRLR